MGPRIVIVGYKPKPGKEIELTKLAKDHYRILKEQDLVTDREPTLMQAKDGTIIEIFEWRSEETIKQAHTNPAVLKMWGEYSQVCDYVPIGQVQESLNLFSELKPL